MFSKRTKRFIILAVVCFFIVNIAVYASSWGFIFTTAHHVLHNTAASVIIAFLCAEALIGAVASVLAWVLIILGAIGGGIWYALRGR